jgi:hypothetical protein
MEISYDEFLKQLSQIPFSELEKQKAKTPAQIYEELCLDFPLVTKDELQILLEELEKQVCREMLQEHIPQKRVTLAKVNWNLTFTLKRSFFTGLQYCTQQTKDSPSANEQIYQILAISTLKLIKVMLRYLLLILSTLLTPSQVKTN